LDAGRIGKSTAARRRRVDLKHVIRERLGIDDHERHARTPLMLLAFTNIALPGGQDRKTVARRE
jgi:hypothetical protein